MVAGLKSIIQLLHLYLNRSVPFWYFELQYAVTIAAFSSQGVKYIANDKMCTSPFVYRKREY